MNQIIFKSRLILSIILTFFLAWSAAVAQPEVMAWGNITGMRIDGQKVDFETSLCLIGSSLMDISKTAKEQQRPSYQLSGNTQMIRTELSDIKFEETINDLGNGQAEINITASAATDTSFAGAFMCLELPQAQFPNADIDFVDSTALAIDRIPMFDNRRWQRFDSSRQATAKGIRITAAESQLIVTTESPLPIIVMPGGRYVGNSNRQLFFGILPGDAKKDDSASIRLTLTADTQTKVAPLTLRLDPQQPGDPFDGIGGNFRLQDPEDDPKVIDYNLQNLNVTWGRVEMPWQLWHPEEGVDPIEAARAGNLHPHVHQSMLMAQRLEQLGIPVIVSAWFAPDWAVLDEPDARENGLRGEALNPEKMQSIIRSLAGYLLYLKEAYGVEAVMFSFNESDLGIDVRQTGEEHAALIKTLGRYMASRGLGTKMVLGDNSDATTYGFLTPALNDPETHKYIGAVSFHSWRGTNNWTLNIWADIADQLNVPLIIGEGSTDAAAHRYPDIFLQSTYALNEIDVYVRIMNICQARTILQWQLTSDYSILTGAGIYGSEGKLRTTQRFWNLKQLGMTPPGSFYLPINGATPDVSCTALADIADQVYSFHLVNNGAARKVTMTGLPKEVKELQIYRTDAERDMKEGKTIQVENGTARFTLDSACFTSLFSNLE